MSAENQPAPGFESPVLELAAMCRVCHAELDPNADFDACPACGGAVAAEARPNLDPPGAPARQADRRGILLPRRHAVGGIITPR